MCWLGRRISPSKVYLGGGNTRIRACQSALVVFFFLYWVTWRSSIWWKGWPVRKRGGVKRNIAEWTRQVGAKTTSSVNTHTTAANYN